MKKQYVCPVCGPQEKPCAEMAAEMNALYLRLRLAKQTGTKDSTGNGQPLPYPKTEERVYNPLPKKDENEQERSV